MPDRSVVCAVYFTPIAGYVPSRMAIRYIAKHARHGGVAGADRRHAGAGAVPRPGPTPIGQVVFEADQFVSLATADPGVGQRRQGAVTGKFRP